MRFLFQNKRIPTIPALLILVIVLGMLVFAIQQIQQLAASAENSLALSPQNLQITNVQDTSLTISFTTAVVSRATVSLGGKNYFDDRDSHGLALPYDTHHITITGLVPQAKHYFKLKMNDGTNSLETGTFEAMTGPTLAAAPTPRDPVYGVVVRPDGSPVSGALVHLSLAGAMTSSAVSKDNGKFVIPVSTTRSVGLLSYAHIRDGDPESVSVNAGQEGLGSVSCVVGLDRPLPDVILGRTINCQKKEAGLIVIPQTRVLGVSAAAGAGSISVTNVNEGQIVTDPLPTFRGTAPGSKKLSLEILSTPSISTSTLSKSDGTWVYTFQGKFPVGSQVLRVSYVDSLGDKQSFLRAFKFFPEKPGTLGSVLAASTGTPSAAVTNPVTKATKVPSTGTVEISLGLLMIGVFLSLLGLFGLKTARFN